MTVTNAASDGEVKASVLHGVKELKIVRTSTLHVRLRYSFIW